MRSGRDIHDGKHCAAFGKHAFTKSAQHNAAPGRPACFLHSRARRGSISRHNLKVYPYFLFSLWKNKWKKEKKSVSILGVLMLALLAAGFSTNNGKLCWDEVKKEKKKKIFYNEHHI